MYPIFSKLRLKITIWKYIFVSGCFANARRWYFLDVVSGGLQFWMITDQTEIQREIFVELTFASISKQSNSYVLLRECWRSCIDDLHQVDISRTDFPWTPSSSLVVKFLWILEIHDSSLHGCFDKSYVYTKRLFWTWISRRTTIWTLPVGETDDLFYP